MTENLPTTIKEQDFALTQREAKALMSSTMIPKEYTNNLGNCIIALDLSRSLNVSPFTVMNNLHPIHGKMSWSSSFIIASINSCGRFSPLRYEMKGEGMEMSCRAWALDKDTGDRLDGSLITMGMAHAEGWISKGGSKWKTMPEQMIKYRAAAFFGRLYAPDIFNGMYMKEELEDIGPQQPVKDITPPRRSTSELAGEALGVDDEVEGQVMDFNPSGKEAE